MNTWAVDGLLSGGDQPAEPGWGSDERRLPANSHGSDTGSRCAIRIDRPGAVTRQRSRCPDAGPQFGLPVTHDGAILISDYVTVGQGANPAFRPSCHCACHPCDAAIPCLEEVNGSGPLPDAKTILTADGIVSGGGFPWRVSSWPRQGAVERRAAVRRQGARAGPRAIA